MPQSLTSLLSSANRIENYFVNQKNQKKKKNFVLIQIRKAPSYQWIV